MHGYIDAIYGMLLYSFIDIVSNHFCHFLYTIMLLKSITQNQEETKCLALGIHIGNNMSWSNNLQNVNDSFSDEYCKTTPHHPHKHHKITTYEQLACMYGVRVRRQCCIFTSLESKVIVLIR